MIPLIYAVKAISAIKTMMTIVWNRGVSATSNLLANHNIPSGIPITMTIFRKNLRYKKIFIPTYLSVVPKFLIASPIDHLIAAK